MTGHDESPGGDLTLGIRGVAAGPPGEDGGMPLRIETTRGPLAAIFHPVEGGTGVCLFVSGAMGGVDGPADAIYRRIASDLASKGISTLRLDYRVPNDFQECVLDVLGGCSLLKGLGAVDVVLAGHSFGAAVVISAGELSPIVRGVVAMSPQLFGTHRVEHLGRPLLLIHGTGDTILSHEASEDIYARAVDPRRIVLFAEAGHSLLQVKDELRDLLLDWVPARLAGEPAPTGRDERLPPQPPDPPAPAR